MTNLLHFLFVQDFIELPPGDMHKLLVANTVSMINIRISRWFHPQVSQSYLYLLIFFKLDLLYNLLYVLIHALFYCMWTSLFHLKKSCYIILIPNKMWSWAVAIFALYQKDFHNSFFILDVPFFARRNKVMLTLMWHTTDSYKISC